MTSLFSRWGVAVAMLVVLLPTLGRAELAALSDEDLSDHTGQALLFSDKVAGASGSGMTFYRMGLDSKLDFNANMNRLQLGCGGVNGQAAAGCDIDMDYVRFMGRNGNQAGAPGSDFTLTRPYVELAIKNDGSGQREVVGFKLGAQEANGYVGIGRNYADNTTNQEVGGSCTGANQGNGALACHSGINRLSGYMNMELSGVVPINITLLGSQRGCFGYTTLDSKCADNAPFKVAAWGSRFNTVNIPALTLELSAGFLSAIGIDEAYSNLTENLRFIHGFALTNTKDFSLSFQREQVAYPNWTKTGYARTTNTGWWMNVPDVKVTDLVSDTVNLGLFAALGALGKPGVAVTNIELNSVAPSNCYGGRSFC